MTGKDWRSYDDPSIDIEKLESVQARAGGFWKVRSAKSNHACGGNF